MIPPRPVEEWAKDIDDGFEFACETRNVIPFIAAVLTRYAAEQVAQALRCVHCGDAAEPKSEVRPICEDCWQVHLAQALEATYREAAPYTSKMRFTKMMVDKARAEEREACAKLTENWPWRDGRHEPLGHGFCEDFGCADFPELAAAIRQRDEE